MFFILIIMAKKLNVFFPRWKRLLGELGENFKLARLRRNFSADLVSERAGISRGTLVKIEKGEPSVSIGNYFKVARVFNLENDFLLLCRDDELGRKIIDLGLKTKKRIRMS